jgi:hypothetical protein
LIEILGNLQKYTTEEPDQPKGSTAVELSQWKAIIDTNLLTTTTLSSQSMSVEVPVASDMDVSEFLRLEEVRFERQKNKQKERMNNDKKPW